MKTNPELAIQSINNKFLGDNKTNRYLLDIYRETVEKLIVTNVLVEVWAHTKRNHTHTRGSNCSKCAVFLQIYHSCVDSVFLHLRLLFSMKEPFLADKFLIAINSLTIDDFEAYYLSKYDCVLTPNDKRSIKSLIDASLLVKPKLETLYIKRIEPYQSYVFHQQADGSYYTVNTRTEAQEGMKVVIHSKNTKFSRDLRSAKEMLDLLGGIVHQYLKVSSTYFHTLKLNPKSYVTEISELLGVELDKKTLSNVILNAEKNTEDMVHLLECSGGLKSHNGLVFAKIDSLKGQGDRC